MREMRATEDKGPELKHPDRGPAAGGLERGFSSIGSLTTAIPFKRGRDQRVQQFLLEGPQKLRLQPVIHRGSWLLTFVTSVHLSKMFGMGLCQVL